MDSLLKLGLIETKQSMVFNLELASDEASL